MATAVKGRAKAPAQAGPDPKDGRRRVNGVLVIADEDVPSPLSNDSKTVNFKGFRLLTLEGNKKVFGCADCPDVTGTRGEIVKHRGERHGVKLGRADRRRPQPAAPDEVTSLSLAELMEIARSAPRWAEMFEAEQVKTTDWRTRALTAEARVRQIAGALDRLGFVERVD